MTKESENFLINHLTTLICDLGHIADKCRDDLYHPQKKFSISLNERVEISDNMSKIIEEKQKFEKILAEFFSDRKKLEEQNDDIIKETNRAKS